MLSAHRQTQLVIWVNQILFLGLLWYLGVWTLSMTIMGLYVFGCMSEISLHRFYTHKTYDTGNRREKFLRAFALLTGQGPILSWVTVHRTHHAYEDTAKDPHSPYYLSWWKIYLSLLPQRYAKNLVLDLLKSPGKTYFVWENQYYFWIWCGLWMVTAYINIYLLFFLVSGSAAWYIATCAINVLSHRYVGVKTFDQSVALNSGIMNFFTGIGHHNNHHHDPKNYSYARNGELDIYAWVIAKFFLTKPSQS